MLPLPSPDHCAKRRSTAGFFTERLQKWHLRRRTELIRGLLAPAVCRRRSKGEKGYQPHACYVTGTGPLGSRMAASTRIGRCFDAIGCLLGPLFSDPNIYRAADLLIWCHGANANIEAARIADAMRGFGDREEQAFWIKVGLAITELEAPSRPNPP